MAEKSGPLGGQCGVGPGLCLVPGLQFLYPGACVGRFHAAGAGCGRRGPGQPPGL